MEYNVCMTCGADNGRAGNLFKKNGSEIFECLNCSDTRESGSFVIHACLVRTDEEINKTANILKERGVS